MEQGFMVATSRAVRSAGGAAAGFADRPDRARRGRSAAGQDRCRRRRLSRRGRQHADPAMRQGGRAAAASRASETKSYLGSQGDARFVELIRPIVFGEADAADDRIVGLQTPGGCGALRLGAELVARANPNARIYAGEPTWPNHAPLIASAGVEMVAYPYYDKDSRTICFDRMMDALGEAERGDLVLLHGCCHNPTGADLDMDQWRAVADLIAARGLIPFVDLAYQGFGNGLEADAAGARLVVDGGGAGDRRAELRQEFQLLSRPARHALRQGVERGGRRGRVRQSAAARPDDVVDAARSSGRGRPYHPRRSGAARAVDVGGGGDVRPHPRAARPPRRQGRAPRLYRGAERHVLDAAAQLRRR